jgi:copper chaperone
MNTYKFKTNINCSGCVEKVTPVLNEKKDIKEWNADTANPDKILTVQTETLTAEQVKTIVNQAGYNAEKIG